MCQPGKPQHEEGVFSSKTDFVARIFKSREQDSRPDPEQPPFIAGAMRPVDGALPSNPA
jgi:hypothetical protein